MKEAILSAARAPRQWLRGLYNWTIHWSRTRKAPYALFGIAFAESSFFPIPPDTLLIPMVVADRSKWLRFAAICSIGSVLGGLLGYSIGWGLYEAVGRPIIDFYNLHAAVEVIGRKYSENAFLTVFTAAFTPIPYKAITIAAGLFRISIETLVIASLTGRSLRFFLVAGLLRLFGAKIERAIEKYFDLISIVFLVLLVGGFVVLKYLLK